MLNTKNITRTALFTAVICICSLISISLPGGVPLTLQTFAVSLTGFVLRWKQAAVSVGVYLAVGLAGLPVFSGFSGGLAHFIGPTGGFLLGFLFLAALCGAVPRKQKLLCGVLSLLGLGICHLFGVLQFSLVMDTSPAAAFLVVSLPYAVKDILSVFGAYMTAAALEKTMRSVQKS